jgi:hypothetical protein
MQRAFSPVQFGTAHLNQAALLFQRFEYIRTSGLGALWRLQQSSRIGPAVLSAG